MNEAVDTLGELIKLAQSLLLPKAQAKGQQVDPTQVKVFKIVRQDIDGDRQEEICFAAGIKRNPEAVLYDFEGVWLLDSLGDSYHVVELSVPNSESFRDLVVLDINNDHIPEVVFWFQVGSGAFLSFYVFQWNGNALTSLFPMPSWFSKGFVEMKDLDGDGVDEVVIWEDIYEKGANWAPKRFNIHVFHYNGQTYELEATHQTERYYWPADIVKKNIGIFGISVYIDELAFTTLGGFERLPNNLIQQETALVNQLRSLQLRDRAAVSQQRYEWGNDIAQIESRLEQIWSELRTIGFEGAEYVELRKATPLNFAGVKLIMNNL